MKKTILVLGAAALMASALNAAGNKSCTGLVVSSDGNPGHGKASFSVAGETQLSFHLLVPPGAQIDTQDMVTIELTTPNGYAFQTIDLPVSPSGSTEKARQIHGYPFPVPVKSFASTTFHGKGAQHVYGTIPLAGSLIESLSLYGNWTAKAQLGSGNPCSTSFTVGP